MQRNQGRKLRIVVLVGPKQSGKTTAANILVNDRYFTRMRFADTLKNMLEAMGIPRDYIDGDKKEEAMDMLCGHSARYAMQTLGTEWRNMLDKSLWARITVSKIKQWVGSHEATTRSALNIVIDDCRFPHEIQALHDSFPNQVEVWRIHNSDHKYPHWRMALCRNPFTKWAMKVSGLAIHDSEIWWDYFAPDVVIDNNTTLEALAATINFNGRTLQCTEGTR